MANESLKLDSNDKNVSGAITDNAAQEIRNLRIDDTTKGLKVLLVGGAGTSNLTSISQSTGILLTPNPITTTGTVGLSTALAPIATLAGNSLKFLRVNVGETALEYATSVIASFAGGTTNSILFINPDSTIAQDNANFAYSSSTNTFTFGGGITTLTKVMSGGSATSNFLNITGTMPSSNTATATAISYQITSAGSSSFAQRTFQINLLAGYTGSSPTAAGFYSNAAAGTNTTAYTVAAGGNNALYGQINGTTAGNNTAVQGSASGSSSLNVGGLFKAFSGTNAPAVNNAVAGFALSGTVNVGGYFALTTTPTTLASTAALVADNVAVAADIFQAQDNSTTVFSVKDGGHILVEGVTSTGATGTGKFVFDSTLTSYTLGAASSTDKAIARFSGTGGKTIQDSGITILDVIANAITISTPTVSGTANAINIIAGASSTNNTAGNGIYLAGGAGLGSAGGGDSILRGGTAGLTGVGGIGYLQGGAGGATSGDGGGVIIQGGVTTGGSNAGGYVTIQGGVGGLTSGAGGNVVVQGGLSAGGTTGGYAYLQGGVGGATGVGGRATVIGGNGGVTSGAGGYVELRGGDGVGANSDGGDVYIYGGNKTSAGVYGKIRMGRYGNGVYGIMDLANVVSSDKTFTFPNKTGVIDIFTATQFSSTFETVGRFGQQTSGGTITFGTDGAVLATTVTTTRYARLLLDNVTLTGSVNSLQGTPSFSATFGMSIFAGTGSVYVGIGFVTVAGTGHTFTTDHIGFKILIAAGVASLYATQADGITETASSALTTLSANDVISVCLFADSVAGTVNYFWRKNGGALSSATTLSTHYPDDTLQTAVFQASVANDSTASAQTLIMSSFSYRK